MAPSFHSEEVIKYIAYMYTYISPDFSSLIELTCAKHSYRMSPAHLDGIQGGDEHSAFLGALEDLLCVNYEHCLLLLVLRQLIQDQNATRRNGMSSPHQQRRNRFLRAS